MNVKAGRKELAMYFKGLKELDSHKPDFIIMACNTIHVFRERLQKKTSAEIIDLKKEVEEFLLHKNSGKIFVLGSPLTVSSGLFSFEGIETVKPSREELREISKAVFLYNKGHCKARQASALEKIALRHSDATILLACTEISLMLNRLKCKKIDTVDVMVNAALKRAFRVF